MEIEPGLSYAVLLIYMYIYLCIYIYIYIYKLLPLVVASKNVAKWQQCSNMNIVARGVVLEASPQVLCFFSCRLNRNGVW